MERHWIEYEFDDPVSQYICRSCKFSCMAGDLKITKVGHMCSGSGLPEYPEE